MTTTMPLPFRSACHAAGLLLVPLALAGCALPRPTPTPEVAVPAAWNAPRPAEEPAVDPSLPHGGTQAGLAQWWRRLDDPVLAELIDAAERASPTVAQAASRIAQARASRVSAGAALGPTADATANANRGFQTSLFAVATIAQGTLQASWEPDVFGGNRAARDAAQARLEGSQAGWHDARVSVAAETANQLAAWRACRDQLAVSETDAASRRESARLSGLSTRAGFTAPADDALARASAADAGNRLSQQRAQCEVAVKGLAALTGLEEGALRERLARPAGPVPDQLFAIDALPARVLAQRPDVQSAARDVVAASADVANAEAQRYPRLTIGGNIGRMYVDEPSLSGSINTWSFGPVQLQLPLFDGGKRRANTEAARAKYDEAVAVYRGKVRQAVREVEEALVNLQSTADRTGDAEAAVAGYRAAFQGAQARFDAGLASRIELEDARRTLLNADTTQVNLRRERMAAWIALYKAAGGGWNE
ncbi:efflux transporter outer membrane subunit [Xylophilus sp.]|uniref:efflux transporter outer membrane subunit n=1 Tax=Xylophilus sp. TaxID=2653893 RepID=UPI0013B73626|nr:efflux transporter outer membrane subunit [Xylophilus sp.]KAF1048197.1 MAG: Multidrug/solvent efflux pump outer membrane protein MepC [Xylophilus sp.]